MAPELTPPFRRSALAREIPWPESVTRYPRFRRCGVLPAVSCLVTGAGALSSWFSPGRVTWLESDPQRSRILDAARDWIATTADVPIPGLGRFIAAQRPWPNWTRHVTLERYFETDDAPDDAPLSDVDRRIMRLYGYREGEGPGTGVAAYDPEHPLGSFRASRYPIRCPHCDKPTLQLSYRAVVSINIVDVAAKALKLRGGLELRDIGEGAMGVAYDRTDPEISCRSCNRVFASTRELAFEKHKRYPSSYARELPPLPRTPGNWLIAPLGRKR